MSKYCLVGQDGNAYNLMGYTAVALREEGLGHLENKMYKEATSGDYNHLIVVCNEYVQKANEKAVENGYTEDD